MSPYGNFGHQISDVKPDARIWRYLDLAKFIDLFAKHRLYFRRVDQFVDTFEGMPTTPVLKYQHAQYLNLDQQIGGLFKDPVKEAERMLIKLRECNFINSWYLSDYESAAMWSLYSSIGSGIAIQSTVEDLRAAIPLNVYVGKVAYVNYDTAEVGDNEDLRSILFFKRNHFDHEREVRVLYSIDDAERDSRKTGHYVDDVALEQMIQSVVLAPGTPVWLHESMIAFMQTACPRIEVVPSALEKDPPIK